ncbi:alpha/beta family hydrolase [Marinobacter nauticus]|uniref:alpha/beta family hydrolase n=1 Tax=Marinobacter nauticus TaxID=2743 RepID=UPI001CB8CE03|nr:alpha/beta family hydrolase [Marinobacter nauticus]
MKRIKTKGYGKDAKAVMILAHGAGAPMDSLFMELLAEALAGQGIESVRFEFPYMVKRREDGRKRPPDRQPALLAAFEDQVSLAREELGSQVPLLVGGKSMGGRMATLLAAGKCRDVDGVACYGYPFHPPGKLDRWRIEHLGEVAVPLLVVQGTRDPFGKPDELKAQGQITGLTRLCWLDGGNHDFQPLAQQPEQQADLIAQAALLTRQFAEDAVL